MRFLSLLPYCLYITLLLVSTDSAAIYKPVNSFDLSKQLKYTKDPEKKAKIIESSNEKISSTDTKNLLTLVKLLYDPDAQVRRQATMVLIAIQPVSFTTNHSLIKALGSPNPEVRISAAWIIGSILKNRPEIIEDQSEIIQILLKSLEHSYEEVRRSATIALGNIKPTDSLTQQKLIELLNDPSDVVRVAAKWAYRQINPPVREVNSTLQKLKCANLFSP